MMEEKLCSGIACFIMSFVKFIMLKSKRHENPSLTNLFSFSFIIKSIDTQQIPRIIKIPQLGE